MECDIKAIDCLESCEVKKMRLHSTKAAVEVLYPVVRSEGAGNTSADGSKKRPCARDGFKQPMIVYTREGFKQPMILKGKQLQNLLASVLSHTFKVDLYHPNVHQF